MCCCLGCCAAVWQEDEATLTLVQRHLLRSPATEALDALLSWAELEFGEEDAAGGAAELSAAAANSSWTPATRSKLVKGLPAEVGQPLAKTVEAAGGADTQVSCWYFQPYKPCGCLGWQLVTWGILVWSGDSGQDGRCYFLVVEPVRKRIIILQLTRIVFSMPCGGHTTLLRALGPLAGKVVLWWLPVMQPGCICPHHAYQGWVACVCCRLGKNQVVFGTGVVQVVTPWLLSVSLCWCRTS